MPRRERASVYELEYLLVKHYTQDVLADILGTSARYIRWILSGRKSGALYREAIHDLYEEARREPPPPKKRRRPGKKPTLAYAPLKEVIDVLHYIFNPIEYKVPSPRFRWVHRDTRFLTREPDWPRRSVLRNWNGFFIMVAVPLADSSIQAFKKSGKAYYPPGREPEEEEEREPGEDDISENVEAAWERFNHISDREAALVSHLPVDAWLEAWGEVDNGFGLINFLISRVDSAFPMPPGLEARKLVEAASEQTAVDSTEKVMGQVEYIFLGLYAFSGWKPRGKK